MTTHVMRAVVFDGPACDSSRTRVAELPVPAAGPGCVSIDVHYAGINFKDVMSRRGDPGYVSKWPFVPGLEVGGTVRALGDGVTGLRVGQPVSAYTGSGGLAQVAIADATFAVPVPDRVSLAAAAVAPGALTSAALLVREVGRLRPGESLLVHGAAGGVGQAVSRLARLSGAGLVLGTVGSPGRRNAALRAGYDDVFSRAEDWSAAARAAAGGGVHLILDPQGTAQLERDLETLAPAGRLILFGNASGRPLDPLPAVGHLMRANATISAFSLAGLAQSAPGLLANALADVLGEIHTGALAAELTIVDGLDAAADAQQALAEGRANGKYVVRVDGRSTSPAEPGM